MRARSVLVVVALALTACGSRVTGQQAHTSGVSTGGRSSTANESGLDLPSGTSAGGDTGSATQSGVSGVPSGGGSTSSRRGTASAGSSGSGVTGASAGSDGLTASAPGVTATSIKVGLIYDKNAGTTNAAMGFSGIGQPDFRRDYDALIADVNKRGGILGRKIEPVYFIFDSGGADAGSNIATTEQHACTTFTENRVFVAFYVGGPTFTRCMDKINVVRVGNGDVDQKLLDASKYLIDLSVTLDRAAAFVTDQLLSMGYYDKGKGTSPGVKQGGKIGILRYDQPQYASGARVVREHLEARGYKVTDEIAIKEEESTADVGDETNQIRAAALQMKTDGITHVQFVSDGRAYMELIFMQNAEKQLYRPRYGLASWDGGQALATLLGGGSDANNQLTDSLQIGWFPIFDVERSDWSGNTASQAFQRCLKVLQDAGETFTSGDPTRNKEAIVANECDSFNYFVAAGSNAGANLTPDTFMQGATQVDALDSAITYSLSTSTRRDAFGAVKHASWHSDCTCFHPVDGHIYPV